MTRLNDTTTADGSARSVRSRRGRRILTLVLIVLLLTLGLAVSIFVRLVGVPSTGRVRVETGGLQWVRSIYGMSNAVEDQLDAAQMATPDTDGSLWITDGVHRSLLRFTPNGEYVEAITGPEDAPLVSPSRLTIGPDGLFYVCETLNDTIRVLDADGNEAGSFNIPQPVSVAVSDDRVVVGAVSGFAIFDSNRELIKVIGARGQGDAEFDYVHGIAIGEDGTIFVSDSYNNRLSAYDKDGKRLWMIRTGKPSNGAEMVDGALTVGEATDAVLSGDDALQLPLGLTLDGAGRIVVIDMFDCTLAVFEPDGTYVGKYGAVGADDGQFFYPTSIDYDTDRDWFLVADTLNNRVQIVRIPGSSGSGGAGEAVRRALTGPLRACVPPFILLIIALTISLFIRARRKKQAVGQEMLKEAEVPTEIP